MLQPLNALFYFMSVEITKKFIDDESESKLEVFLNTHGKISFFIDGEYEIALDVETTKHLINELIKEVNYAKEGGSNE
jgi:hypothetical protein